MSATTIPGPHPDPHPPTTFDVPPGACDAHCHIFGPGDRFPFAADRAYTPPDSGIDDFAALQERLGLSRAVFVQASCHGTDNSAMVDAIERGAGRYAGVAMIDESFSDVDIGRLHDVGVRGTRFNFVAHLGGAPELDVFWRIVDRVVPFGWHIVLHFDAKDLPSYADLLDRMPCPFVIDHMARVPTSGGLDQAPFRALLDVLERRAGLGQDLRCRTPDGGRFAAVRRRRPVRAGAHRRRARSRPVGNRLAAPERAPHARRRRPRRPARGVRARRGDPQPDPGDEPGTALRLLVVMPIDTADSPALSHPFSGW